MHRVSTNVMGGSLLAVLMAAAPASAAPIVITFSDMVATWSAPIGGSGIGYTTNGTSTAEVRWGTGGTQQSGYRFASEGTVVAPNLPPTPTNDFVLGTLTHFNFPINGGSGISGITLTLKTQVTATEGSTTHFNELVEFVYNVVHWETPNGDNPCADGGAHGVGVNVNGCADNVKLNFNQISGNFKVGDDDYSLDVRGFAFQDGSKATSFWTTENQANEAFVLGRVALRSEIGTLSSVPEPASLVLMGLALAGLGARRRRRTAA